MKGLIMFALAMAASAAAQGAALSVASSPSSAQAEFGRATPVTVAWIFDGVASGAVTSAKGTFRAENGDTLGVVQESLTKAVAAEGDSILTETVTVPSSVVVRAHLLGLTQIRYERSFSAGGSETVGSMALYIITGAGVGKTPTTGIPGSDRKFDLSYLSISFNDNGLVASVAPGDTPRAKAKARFTANRIVSATWEIAGPNPGKQPVFVPLANVSQMVEPDRDTYFQSPPLPTDRTGEYLLRLTITTPAVEFDEPVLHYFVQDQGRFARSSTIQTSSLDAH